MKVAITGSQEEVTTLTQTILKLTETLKGFEKTQSELQSNITTLSDELEVLIFEKTIIL